MEELPAIEEKIKTDFYAKENIGGSIAISVLFAAAACYIKKLFLF